ncbi:MAG TPA: lipoprotein, partial [Bacillota bacterium]|nr:lipoprotein [Bacillota bacterium]
MKKLYLLFLVLVMTVVLSGCNNSLSTTDSLTTTNINPSQTTDENSVVLLKDSHYQYSIYSTENIKILHLNVTSDVEVFNKDMNQLNKEDILLLNNQKYEIKSSYITNHIDSVVEFY